MKDVVCMHCGDVVTQANGGVIIQVLKPEVITTVGICKHCMDTEPELAAVGMMFDAITKGGDTSGN